MVRSRSAAAALLVAADAGVLAVLWPDLPSLARHLAAPRQWLADAGADRVLVDVAGAGLWLAGVWVGAGLLAATLGRLPGAAGAAATAVARRTLPAVLRRIVIGSAGLGVLLTPISPLAAGAQPPSDGPGGRPTVTAAPLPGPSWPGSGDGSATPGTSQPAPLPPGPSWPGSTLPEQVPPPSPRTPARSAPAPTPAPTPTSTPTPTTTPASAPDRPRTSPDTHPAPRETLPTVPRGASPVRTGSSVTVRAGDSLWLLAAHRLGPRVPDSDVAAYLPELYAANRSVIGDDPDLVRPGQVLSLPVPGPSTNPQESP